MEYVMFISNINRSILQNIQKASARLVYLTSGGNKTNFNSIDREIFYMNEIACLKNDYTIFGPDGDLEEEYENFVNECNKIYNTYHKEKEDNE